MKSALMAVALGASLILPAAAFAADRNDAPRIVVLGEGQVAVAPDLAVLTLMVTRDAPTAREALDANNAAMQEVIGAIKASGIADKDLQTAGLQINPRYDYTNRPDGTQDAKLVGYQVANTLNVTVHEIAKSGEILDKAVTLGVNQGGGVTFSNNDLKTPREAARKDAVADAKAKALTLAEAAGVELGKILEISETSYAQPPMPVAKTYARAADAVPLQAGENTYQVQVNVTFEIK